MNMDATAALSPLVMAHVRHAAMERGIRSGNAAAIVCRLEEMADGLVSAAIFPALFSSGSVASPALSPRKIGELFWRERLASLEIRRQEGSFYTPEPLVDRILDSVFPRLAKAGFKKGGCGSVCDPAVGCGFFLLRLVERLGATARALPPTREWALRSLYGVDTDAAAVFMTRVLLWLALSDGKGEFRPEPEHFPVGDSLLGPAFGEAGDGSRGLDWNAAMPGIAENGGFDAVVGNPPYEVLTNFGRHPGRKIMAGALRESGYYREAVRGQINLYRCFIERGLALTRQGGALSYVVPLSLARDGAAEGVRRRLLEDEKTDEWLLLGENEKVFSGVTQAACVFRAQRGGGRARRIAVAAMGDRSSFALRELETGGGEVRIPGLSRDGLELWRWLYAHCPGRLGEVAEARVGEVDQTVYRDCMVAHDTGCILARGEHLRAFRLDAVARKEKARFLDLQRYLSLKGAGAEACLERAGHWRIVQLGIRNLHSVPRLVAALAPPGVHLGNSLNVYYPRDGVSHRYVAGVLNSKWLDWLFRVGSGNNNINLREMLALPFPSRPTQAQSERVEEAYRVCGVDERAADPDSVGRVELDRAVAACYGVPEKYVATPLPAVL